MTNSNDAIAVRPVRKAKSRKLNRVGSRAPHIAQQEPKTIGERITKRRLELRLTQGDVARQVLFHRKSGRNKGTERKLSRATLAMYEIGLAEPDLRKIEQIAKALGVTPGWLAFGECGGEQNDVAVLETSEEQVTATGDIKIETWVLPQVADVRNPQRSTGEARTLIIRIPR